MTWLLAHFEAVFITLMALFAAVVILQQRRSPQSTAAWLLFIIVLPYAAIPLFLALGFRKRSKWFKPISFDTPKAPPSDATETAATASVLEQFGLPPATDGNNLRLLATGEAAFDALRSLCRSAQTDLDCLFYIVANDEVGRAFVSELTARARAGVKVRLLLDSLGSLRPPRAALAKLRAAGGEVRFVSPLLQRPGSGHLNLRNHRKMVIADGDRVFAGGMNVGADYMGPSPDPERWRDLGCLLEGPGTTTFRAVFRADWEAAGGTITAAPPTERRASAGAARVQLVPSGPDIRGDPLHDALVNAIHAANRRIWLATPYFLPTEFLEKALAIAARRGLDVRLIVPQKSNQRMADFARGAYLRDMQEAGCKVQLFQNGMIHAKAGIIDEIGFLGSANLDVRSMFLNFETALFVYDDASVEALEDWYLAQERACVTGVPVAGRIRRISEGVFRLGAPVL